MLSSSHLGDAASIHSGATASRTITHASSLFARQDLQDCRPSSRQRHKRPSAVCSAIQTSQDSRPP
jgi:hypothetical protein